MMKPKQKQFVRKVTALVDADATYVSLVSTGANGSPFNVVKQENPTMGVKIKPRPEAKKKATGKKSAKKNANNRVVETPTHKNEDRAITRFFYSKDSFDTEDAVREHILNSDFEGDFDIEDDDDQFVVVSKDVEPENIIKSAMVETGEEGVTAEVSIIKAENSDEGGDEAALEQTTKSESSEDEDEDEDDDEDDEDEDDGEEDDAGADAKSAEGQKGKSEKELADPSASVPSKKAQFLAKLRKKSEEDDIAIRLQKYDFWEVYYDDSSDFMTLLKSGYSDALAPSFDDVLWTYGQSIKNALTSEDSGMEDALRKSSEDFVTVIKGMHDLFSQIVNASEGDVQKIEADRSETLQKWAEEFGLALVQDTDRATKREDASAEKITKSETTSEDMVKRALATALEPVLTQLSTVSETVDKMSSRRQVSKGIDPADATASEGAKPTKKEDESAEKRKAATERLTRSVFAVR